MWLPPVQPREAYKGYLLRVAATNRSEDLRRLSRHVFGAAWRVEGLDWLLPSALERMASELLSLKGLETPRAWLMEHTAYPYFASALDADQALSLERRQLGTVKGPVRPFLPLTAAESVTRRIRACQVCRRDDHRVLGVSYVRVEHMLPYVSRCALHGTRLTESASWRPVDTPAQLLAMTVKAADSPDSVEFAHRSSALLAGGISRAWNAVNEAVQSRGWRRKSGALDHRAVREAMEDAWHDGFDDPGLNQLVRTEVGQNRLLAALARDRGRVHPVAAILVLKAAEIRGRISVGQLELVPRRHLARAEPVPASETGDAAPTQKTDTLRLAAALNERRQAWRQARLENPSLGTKELRTRVPGTYYWLYRNDRSWLQENLPPRVASERRGRRRLPPGMLLLQKLRDARQRLLALPGRPARVTWAKLLDEAGLPRSVVPKDLAECSEPAQALVESDTMFVTRRLEWAVAATTGEGRPLVVWQLLKRAGLRIETYAKAGVDPERVLLALAQRCKVMAPPEEAAGS